MPDHPHGTLSGARFHHCTCTPCREASRRYHAQRRTQTRNGQWQGLIPTDEARTLIHTWLDQGITTVGMTEATGISTNVFQTINRGQLKTIQAITWDCIRDATPKPSPHGTVPATGTQRRIQGLQAVGWTARLIGEVAGISEPRVQKISKAPRVAVSTRDAIERATRYLITREAPTDKQSPGSAQARRTARKLGWVPVAAWDDVDNPDEMPKTAPPPRTYHGRLPAPDVELIDRIHRLKREGLTDQQIAYRLNDGRSAASVQKIRRRHPAQETHYEV